MNNEELIKECRVAIAQEENLSVNMHRILNLCDALEVKNREVSLLRQVMEYRAKVISGFSNDDPGIAAEHSAIAENILRDLKFVDYEMGAGQ